MWGTSGISWFPLSNPYVGLLDRLGLTRQRFDDLSGVVDLGIASPWQEGNLSAIVPSDIFGEDIAANLPLSRAEAMSIPAVAKARNLLVSTVMRFPLVSLKANSDERVDPQPTFLYRTNMRVSPQERSAWTLDDFMFYGRSLWAVERGADGSILKAAWVHASRWKITNGRVLLDDKPVSDEEVLLFNPPFEGLLAYASRTLRGARAVEDAWVARAKNPIPLLEFDIEDMDLANLDQEKIDGWIAAWVAKHSGNQPPVGATPPGVKLVDHGQADPQMYVEARNAIRTDIGSHLNIRAAMLDGTIGVDSLTYTTTEGVQNSFYEFDMPFWLIPIEARLSLDDVVPAGQRVRFDKYAQYGTPLRTDVPTED